MENGRMKAYFDRLGVSDNIESIKTLMSGLWPQFLKGTEFIVLHLCGFNRLRFAM